MIALERATSFVAKNCIGSRGSGVVCAVMLGHLLITTKERRKELLGISKIKKNIWQTENSNTKKTASNAKKNGASGVKKIFSTTKSEIVDTVKNKRM